MVNGEISRVELLCVEAVLLGGWKVSVARLVICVDG
jgi:hypothetical protein